MLTLAAPAGASAQPSIAINNACSFPIWIDQTPNTGYSPLPSNNPSAAGKLETGQTATYPIPAGGWAGRFWPKTGCDANGNNCVAGSSVSGCPPTGCEPPADTKVEFNYPPQASDRPFYDITLVDGYSLSAKITPSQTGGERCTPTECAVSLAACPTDEIKGIGSLQVVRSGQVVQCLSPCKRWNYPAPYGLGRPETVPPGNLLCCPTPPVTPGECNDPMKGIVEKSQYVQLVRRACPTAYSYTYDDLGGSHDCPPGTSFTVAFCQ
ncbi:MAG: thaumatin family protein [Candidatus Rokuibacteriota bacterium]